MPKKVKSYTGIEQEWLEDLFREWREYIDSYRPFKEKIEDRTEIHPNAKGDPIIKVIATKERTVETLMKVFKELPILIKELDELRDRKAASIETRGDIKVPGAMKQFIEERT